MENTICLLPLQTHHTLVDETFSPTKPCVLDEGAWSFYLNKWDIEDGWPSYAQKRKAKPKARLKREQSMDANTFRCILEKRKRKNIRKLKRVTSTPPRPPKLFVLIPRVAVIVEEETTRKEEEDEEDEK